MPAVLYPVGPQQPADFRGLAFARSQQRAPQNLVSLFDQNRQGGGNDLMSVLLPLLFSQQGRAEERRQFNALLEERGEERTQATGRSKREFGLLSRQATSAIEAQRATTNAMLAALLGGRTQQAVAAQQNRFGKQIEDAQIRGAHKVAGAQATITRKEESAANRAVDLTSRLAALDIPSGQDAPRTSAGKEAVVKFKNELTSFFGKAKQGDVFAQRALQDLVEQGRGRISNLVPPAPEDSPFFRALTIPFPGRGQGDDNRLNNLTQRSKIQEVFAEIEEWVGTQSPLSEIARRKQEAGTVPEVERLRLERDAALQAAVEQALAPEEAARREREFFEQLDQQIQTLGLPGGP